MDNANKPTLLVLTPDNYLVLVGEPGYVSEDELSQYLKEGYSMKIVSFSEYAKSEYEWIYDKPKLKNKEDMMIVEHAKQKAEHEALVAAVKAMLLFIDDKGVPTKGFRYMENLNAVKELVNKPSEV